MLGFFDNSLNDKQIAPSNSGRRQSAKRAITPSHISLKQLAEREWAELPYAMMRLTPAKRQYDGKPLFWQDDTLQLGDIDLNLIKVCVTDHTPAYIAAFSINETRHAVAPRLSPRAEQTKLEFRLHPSLEENEFRWTSPKISESLKLKTDQVAEKLLSKLVVFYTRGLS